jgi:hypothetical protein
MRPLPYLGTWVAIGVCLPPNATALSELGNDIGLLLAWLQPCLRSSCDSSCSCASSRLALRAFATHMLVLHHRTAAKRCYPRPYIVPNLHLLAFSHPNAFI